jgi:hypothetical protein
MNGPLADRIARAEAEAAAVNLAQYFARWRPAPVPVDRRLVPAARHQDPQPNACRRRKGGTTTSPPPGP